MWVPRNRQHHMSSHSPSSSSISCSMNRLIWVLLWLPLLWRSSAPLQPGAALCMPAAHCQWGRRTGVLSIFVSISPYISLSVSVSVSPCLYHKNFRLALLDQPQGMDGKDGSVCVSSLCPMVVWGAKTIMRGFRRTGITRELVKVLPHPGPWDSIWDSVHLILLTMASTGNITPLLVSMWGKQSCPHRGEVEDEGLNTCHTFSNGRWHLIHLTQRLFTEVPAWLLLSCFPQRLRSSCVLDTYFIRRP